MQPDRFRMLWERGFARGRTEADEAWRLRNDPFNLGVLRTLVQKIKDSSFGLTGAQRLALEQELLDVADELAHRKD